MSEHFPMDEEICSAVLEEPLSGAVEERNTAEECEAPAPPRVAWGNNTSEKQSRWMSFRAGVLRVWNAGERLFQTNETQVCAFVPSQELPHTPSVEPTDPLESRPTDPLESRPTDPLESRPTDPPRLSPGRRTRSCPGRQTRPVQVQANRPAPLESRPTDPLESRPTDPLESRPTNPPRLSPGRRTCSCPGRQTRPVQVQADRPAPLESRPTDPLKSRPTDPPSSSPGRQTRPARVLVQADTNARVPPDFIRTNIYFKAIYEAGRKLKSRGDRSDYKGVRISDDERVIIRCIKKSRPEKLVELPESPIPMSREAAAMLMLQKSLTSTHINQLYDMYVLKDRDVLVLEYAHHRMTLFEFVQRNRSSLKEHVVKYIVEQLVVALQHCMDHGVYHKTHMMNVLIYPNTLKVKLTDFRDALIFEERRADEPILNSAVRESAEWVTEDIHILLDQLVKRIAPWFWQRSRLSKECLDLLEKLNDRRSGITLDAILHHDWFKNPSDRR